MTDLFSLLTMSDFLALLVTVVSVWNFYHGGPMFSKSQTLLLTWTVKLVLSL